MPNSSLIHSIIVSLKFHISSTTLFLPSLSNVKSSSLMFLLIVSASLLVDVDAIFDFNQCFNNILVDISQNLHRHFLDFSLSVVNSMPGCSYLFFQFTISSFSIFNIFYQNLQFLISRLIIDFFSAKCFEYILYNSIPQPLFIDIFRVYHVD